MGRDRQEEKFIRMTTRPVGGLVTSLAVPSIISMLVTGFYNLADTFFVGQINTQSVAALGIVFSYMALIQAIAFYFGQGSGNYISRALGRRRTDDAAAMAATGFFSAFLAGVLIALSGWLLTDPLLRLFGSTDTILPYAREYFRYILPGTPFIMCCFTMNNQMRQQGNALLSMVGIASGALLNIALDAALILGLGMGIRGAGIATTASQVFSFFVMLALCGRRGGIRIRFRNFKPAWSRYVEINAGGLPSLARQGLMSLAAICLNQLASEYGDASVAAFSEEDGIVDVLDHFRANNTAYIVMEYLDGENLRDYINHHGRFRSGDLISLMMPVMKSLRTIHAEGIIHRDISPDNIMFTKNGKLKLMDFGSARYYTNEERHMSVVLKKGYAPEEQYGSNTEQGTPCSFVICA